jgi:hypothetical protein
VIDSGASLPMCYQKEAFNYIVPDYTPVKLGNGQVIYSRGKGNVGNLTNVYYVPDLAFNLLSVTYLNNLGFEVIFTSTGSVIMKDSSNNVHNIGIYKDGLFKTDAEILKLDINKSNTQYSLTIISSDRINYNKLIHNRFAHINDMYLNIAINKKLVTGIKIDLKSRIVNGVQTFIPGRFRSEFCESCIMSKSIRVSSTKTPGSSHTVEQPIETDSNDDNSTIEKPKKNVRFSDSLEIVQKHSNLHCDPTIIPPPLSKLAVDIKGPVNVADKSHNAKKYALIFTCTTTRFRFVAFLKAKDEAVKYTEKLLNYIRTLNKTTDSIEQ